MTVPAVGGTRFKLTPERITVVCESLALGHTLAYAASCAGFSERTLRRYRADGQDALQRFEDGEEITETDALLADFMLMLEAANKEAEARFLGIIIDAAEKQWQAAAWILERRFRKDWSRAAQVDHTGTVDIRKRVTMDFGVPENAQIMEAAKRLREKERAEEEAVEGEDYEILGDEDEEDHAA